MGGLKRNGLFEQIYSLENLRIAFENFKRGKAKKPDIINFSEKQAKEIYKIYDQVRRKSYRHGPYKEFYIQDPKIRKINKATARDRVVHHALFRKLYPIFDRTFIFDSYSCRIGKGTHQGVRRLQKFVRKTSKNNRRICWVLKCDIRKFFDNINHNILMQLIGKRVKDRNALWLAGKIVESFSPGLPLGNITSQLFANIYLHELDMFIKHDLRVRYYIRYCDDFIILHEDKDYVKSLIPKIDKFLISKLNMQLHPNKIIIHSHRQGADFLGYVSFHHHVVLRPKTSRRLLRRVNQKNISSYLGVLKHCNSYKLRKRVLQMVNHENS